MSDIPAQPPWEFPSREDMKAYLLSKRWTEQVTGYWIHPTSFNPITRDLVGAYACQRYADHEKQRLAEHLKTVAK